jgi:hypothetical protein
MVHGLVDDMARRQLGQNGGAFFERHGGLEKFNWAGTLASRMRPVHAG